MRSALWLFVMATLSGCAPMYARRETAAERCRSSAAASQVMRGFSGKQNPVATALEDGRCDALEAQERSVEHQRNQERSADVTRRAELDRQVDVALAEIRRSPNVPEIGATVREGAVICERQRGAYSERIGSGPRFDDIAVVTCRVGGQPIFSCLVTEGRTTRCDAFYEGGDLAEARRRLQASLGPAETETVSDDGFRVFTWRNGAVVLTMYATGVRVSTRTVSPEP